MEGFLTSWRLFGGALLLLPRLTCLSPCFCEAALSMGEPVLLSASQLRFDKTLAAWRPACSHLLQVSPGRAVARAALLTPGGLAWGPPSVPGGYCGALCSCPALSGSRVWGPVAAGRWWGRAWVSLGAVGGVLWGQSLMSLLVKVVSTCRNPCLICIAKTSKVNVR